MGGGVIGNTTVSEAVIASSSLARPTTKIIHLWITYCFFSCNQGDRREADAGWRSDNDA